MQHHVEATVTNFISLFSSELCMIAQGTSFFKFDIGEQTTLTSPPTLILRNCQFKNFLMEFNSFIETNPFGGHIYIVSTTFDRFSSCGAIVRNFKKVLKYDKRVVPETSYSNYFSRMNRIQYDQYKTESTFSTSFDPFEMSCSTDIKDSSTCFSLSVSQSTFKNFGFKTKE